MNMHRRLMRAARPAFSFCFALLLGAGGIALAAVVPDVRSTKHNLSTTSTGTVKATSETQVCVFCHTPHAANISVAGPLWNRALSSATYTTYTSSSIEANAAELAAGPGGTSKLCLSCHDGTLAIGNVNVLNGQSPVTIAMSGTDAGAMPAGSGASTGFTRKLGVDLSNDHPISFTYDDALATADGELRPITGNPAVATRVAGVNPKPQFPLEGGQMQCSACHDPHLYDQNEATNGKLKFLRGNRLQQAAPVGGSFDTTNDIICLSCHDKAGQAWAYSAHANPLTADEVYTNAAATQREFPLSTPVWKAACLNCHDTHTVQGSRRLLREGTDSVASPKSGGNPSIEETCYQCHSSAATRALTAQAPDKVPNIKDEFAKAVRMPINNTDQGVATEVHDIGTGAGSQRGKDFVEGQTQLGVGNLTNRHAECTDCHNPHRVIKNELFNGNAAVPDGAGTHKHTDDAATLHTNIASGVLRGTFGVEPTYASNSFHVLPSGFTVKRGDPGASVSTLVTESFVTREYQICLKCHSNYGYTDNNQYGILAGDRPTLGGTGSTASGSNGVTVLTNQAKEFHAPLTHQNEPLNLGTDGGAGTGVAPNIWNTENHRSWHPVMDKTGRTFAKRSMTNGNSWRLPWRNDIGNQTMYCTDCHGENVTSTTSVIPNGGVDGTPWGPHGSAKPFLLKGDWVDTTGSNANLLCFRCHTSTTYSGSADTGQTSGFYAPGSGGWGGAFGNLHNFHVAQLSKELRCTWCHVAVPHGWKNKSLLVNLNDVGGEAGYPGLSKEVSIQGGGRSGTDDFYSQQPYYFKAKVKIINFSAAGLWVANDCGSKNKAAGDRINGSAGATNNNNTGVTWMRDTCGNPP